MFYEPSKRNHGLPHDPFQALVAPRPIGWISTLSASGALNLAPYSYFNALSSNPWLIMFSASSEKDSVVFARERGEFVANLVSANLADAMVQSSIPAPRGVSEFELAGLTPEPGRNVSVPRVREAFAALECRLTEIWRPQNHSNPGGAPFVVTGEVVGVYIDERILTDGLVDIAKARPVSRLGYLDYGVTAESFPKVRPQWNPRSES
jgi:flavin reductase (DIM6/NTAB) family NADH-FMN oxidoreductase RutF